jgi:Rieske Fe-S protein
MRRSLPVIDGIDRRQLLLLGAAAGMMACGSDVGEVPLDDDAALGDDTGDPNAAEDTGSEPEDVGAPPEDRGSVDRDVPTTRADAGFPSADGGVPSNDAGFPSADAGRPGTDAGRPGMDAGSPSVDAGSRVDASMPTDTGRRRDAGPADTGARTDTGVRCPTTGGIGSSTALAVGAFRSVTVGTRRLIVGRDAGGLYAFSATCTHQGCTLPTPVRGTITCPCHGAQFDANGAVTRGPARTSLAHYSVTVCAGQAYIGTTTVPAATRTAV